VNKAPNGGARSIYQAYNNGDKLTDAEIEYGMQHFKALDELARSAGPVFQLAANEAMRVHRALNDFYVARRTKS